MMNSYRGLKVNAMKCKLNLSYINDNYSAGIKDWALKNKDKWLESDFKSSDFKSSALTFNKYKVYDNTGNYYFLNEQSIFLEEDILKKKLKEICK
jgi:hypothetical protein